MIRYTLKCANAHSFESWFRSSEAYETLDRSGNVTCPECGDTRIEKALMAPKVRPARSAASPTPPSPAEPEQPLSTPQTEREAALAALKKKIEADSEYVGLRFAAEARKIHDGNAPARAIHGEAKADDAKRLIEDGVPVAPLPFMPKAKTN